MVGYQSGNSLKVLQIERVTECQNIPALAKVIEFKWVTFTAEKCKKLVHISLKMRTKLQIESDLVSYAILLIVVLSNQLNTMHIVSIETKCY